MIMYEHMYLRFGRTRKTSAVEDLCTSASYGRYDGANIKTKHGNI